MPVVLPESLNQKRVAVWGFGVEGRATASCLARFHPGCQFTVFCRPEEKPSQADDPARGWNFCTEPVTPTHLNDFDLVIKSPGISPYRPPASALTVPVLGAAALWFAYHRQGRVIAVTGTKGKSTTASLLAHILRGLGYSVNLAGNIGAPLLDMVGSPADWTVLETSSYQAADGAIAADVAVLLNLFPEHLDWHGSEARYYADKLRLLENAGQAILGQARNHFLARLDKAGLAIPGPLHTARTPRFSVAGENLTRNGRCVFSARDWALQGRHNLQNLAAVLEVIARLDLPVEKALTLARSFQPLPHRLQPLGRIGQWHWINDSIASTPHATLAALATVTPRNTTVILGGYDRQLDWDEFARAIASAPPVCLVVSGESRPRILAALKKQNLATRIVEADDLAQAVSLAAQHTPANGTVLLSPGAPSFDAFDNYAQRGEAFEQLVRQWAGEEGNAQPNGRAHGNRDPRDSRRMPVNRKTV